MAKPPKPCIACRARPAAWTTPRVDYCYDCLPGGPFAPPGCSRCGAGNQVDGYPHGVSYYSQGTCTRCHPNAPQRLESCRDCHAWGVIRKYKWLCWRCHSWRERLPKGCCRICRRVDLAINPDQVCNLCDRQMSIALGATVEEANAGGPQLYFANMPWQPTRIRWGNVRRVDKPSPRNLHRHRADRFRTLEFNPVENIQLALFDLPRDLASWIARSESGRAFAEQEPLVLPNEDMAAFLDAAVLDHARRHGWPKSTIHRTQRSLRVLQFMQDTPGAMLLASDALSLQQIGLTAIPVIEVATLAGVMVDDRHPAIDRWFADTIADLPDPMKAELRDWSDIMLNGSTTPPRRRPREQETMRHYLRGAMPALTTWADQGHTSLREITHADVIAILPPSGNPRSIMGAGLRSIFTLLKARKTLFVNPIARVRTGTHERRQPLPLDTASIQNALNSPNPACAAIAALAAFHGIRTRDVRHMALTDLADGRLRINQPADQRRILLAEPVKVRLAAWLAHRAQRWPNTANPYLFINHRNAGKLIPVGFHWVSRTMDVPVSVIRDDRILHEVDATSGDLRRICELFGIKVETALRYLPTTDLDEAHTLPGATDKLPVQARPVD